MKRDLPEPTRAELDILRLLWKEGKLSTREIHEHLSTSNAWAYSTTRTVIDRMARKGLLERSEFHGVHLYGAALSRPRALARMIEEFADRVLELDCGSLVPLFARSKSLSPAELEELSQLLRKASRRGRA